MSNIIECKYLNGPLKMYGCIVIFCKPTNHITVIEQNLLKADLKNFLTNLNKCYIDRFPGTEDVFIIRVLFRYCCIQFMTRSLHCGLLYYIIYTSSIIKIYCFSIKDHILEIRLTYMRVIKSSL